MRQLPLIEAYAAPDGQQLHAAILTTFELDLGYLERYLLPAMVGLKGVTSDPETEAITHERAGSENELRERLRNAHVAVLADRRRFDFLCERHFETYDLWLLEMGGAFHPKVALLAFDHDFRLIVSSANLTQQGFHRNLEVAYVASSAKGDHFGAAAKSAMDFIARLQRKYLKGSRALSEALRAIRPRLPKGPGNCRLLHSESNRPILEQWIDSFSRSGRPDELHIVSPFFDSGPSLRPAKHLAAHEVFVYVIERQSPESTAYPVQASRKAVSLLKPIGRVIRPSWASASANPETEASRPRALHAKCYAARFGTKGSLLLGSPNFTANAMFGRNAEAAVLLKGAWAKICKALPPTKVERLGWNRFTFDERPPDSEEPAWLPFLESAEYIVEAQRFDLRFCSRLPTGPWSVAYAEKILAQQNSARFPATRSFKKIPLGVEACLTIREGKHKAKFPFTIVDKELLPLVPGLAALDYGQALEYLACGAPNLMVFQKRVMKVNHKERKNSVLQDSVPEMEWLRRLTRALEQLRRRLSSRLSTVGEARALFRGDLGVARISNELWKDKSVNSILRTFALLEIGAVIASVRWRGERAARRAAGREAKALQSQIRNWTRHANSKIVDRYRRHGREGWGGR